MKLGNRSQYTKVTQGKKYGNRNQYAKVTQEKNLVTEVNMQR